MDNEANTTTEAANDLNPNGFITNRELDGERRSIRHYNDGRVSGRGRSVEGSLRTKMRKNSTGAGGRARPPTSRSRDLSGRATPAVRSGPSDIADITAAMAKLTVDHPTSPKVKKLSKKLNLDAYSGIETVALRKVTPSSTASVASSTCSTGSRSSVNARIAEIEGRVRKHIKTRLHSITEEQEE
ncbi:EF-Hand 1, calcium-binding site [Penicillium camemberti]|uniref:EF-Hand 1, calcium-binding site n=1 Tax=Penicillium camemberti (strain FM 013) TaxID=1429867 RepID=A0A0G4PP71_PENC3|nr:EF-Hand 1, calcium-binding site [Penicillium camemberti]